MKILPVSFVNKHFNLIVKVLIALLAILLPAYATMVVNSPDDYLQEGLVRIMYIHVPAAWIALGIYGALAFSAGVFIVYKNPQYHVICLSLAPIGLVYTVIALVTGSIWGKPAWGTWWVWDARLTSMLMLSFIYCGYISISNHNIRNERLSVVSAYYAVIGFIIIPVIKFSVDLWSTLHQPSSVFKISGTTIHYDILKVLLIALIFHFIIVLLVSSMNIRTYWLKIIKHRLK